MSRAIVVALIFGLGLVISFNAIVYGHRFLHWVDPEMRETTSTGADYPELPVSAFSPTTHDP